MEFSCQPELKVKTKQDFSMAQWFALDAFASGKAPQSIAQASQRFSVTKQAWSLLSHMCSC